MLYKICYEHQEDVCLLCLVWIAPILVGWPSCIGSNLVIVLFNLLTISDIVIWLEKGTHRYCEGICCCKYVYE